MHVGNDLSIIGKADGWDADRWHPITDNLAKMMSWSKPVYPKPGDPMPDATRRAVALALPSGAHSVLIMPPDARFLRVPRSTGALPPCLHVPVDGVRAALAVVIVPAVMLPFVARNVTAPPAKPRPAPVVPLVVIALHTIPMLIEMIERKHGMA